MLSTLEKSVLFHRHEANRFRLFGNEYLRKRHEETADSLQRMMDLKKKNKEGYENSLRERHQG